MDEEEDEEDDDEDGMALDMGGGSEDEDDEEEEEEEEVERPARKKGKVAEKKGIHVLSPYACPAIRVPAQKKPAKDASPFAAAGQTPLSLAVLVLPFMLAVLLYMLAVLPYVCPLSAAMYAGSACVYGGETDRACGAARGLRAADSRGRGQRGR
eukprot:2521552-Rhodomonas_salina.1